MGFPTDGGRRSPALRGTPGTSMRIVGSLLCVLLAAKASGDTPVVGEALPATEDVLVRGDSASLSPDGRWLLLYGKDTTPAAPRILLYSTADLAPVPVAPSPPAQQLAEQRRGPFLTGGCWEPDSRSVLLLGMQGSDLFRIDLRHRPLRLEAVAGASAAQRRAVAACAAGVAAASGLAVRDTARGGAEIVAASGQSLAVFEPSRLQTRVAVEALRLSSDGRYAAFVLTRLRGSFVASSTGYLLGLSSPQRPLSRAFGHQPIPPLLWGPGACCLYAYDRDGKTGLFRRWDTRALFSD